jgi:predicted kinase
VSLFLLQMAGLPGSGKTALSRAIGRHCGAAVLDKDVLMGAAERCGIEPERLGRLAYEQGYALARSILANGLSVVLDSPANFIHIREQGARIAAETGAAYFIIECVVPHAVSEARITRREPVHSLHPSTLAEQDLTYSRPGTAVLTEPRLQLDTTRPFDECLREALEYIGR